MIIEVVRTGNRIEVSEEQWQKIIMGGMAKRYKVVSEETVPTNIKKFIPTATPVEVKEFQAKHQIKDTEEAMKAQGLESGAKEEKKKPEAKAAAKPTAKKKKK